MKWFKKRCDMVWVTPFNKTVRCTKRDGHDGYHRNGDNSLSPPVYLKDITMN